MKKDSSRIDFDVDISEKTGSVWIIGLDEVGYGCFAGPLVVGAVAINVADLLVDHEKSFLNNEILYKVKDSKKLSEKNRLLINEKLQELSLTKKNSLIISIGESSVDDINTKGVTVSHDLATSRAIAGVLSASIIKENDKKIVLLDGNKVDSCLKSMDHMTFVKGDNLSFTIGCASVIAKSYRDSLMVEFSKKYNGYGFESNKGYGTKEHRDAIRLLGLCPEHRIKYCESTLK